MTSVPSPTYKDIRSTLPRNTANALRWLRRRPRSQIQYFFVHYPDADAPAPTEEAEIAQLRGFSLFHIQKDWSTDHSGVYGWGIMYHWAIGPSGTVYVLNDPEDILWNTTNGNPWGVATLVLVGQNQQMTPAQGTALVKHLAYQEALRYSAASRVRTFGHGECGGIYGGGPSFQNATRCPGPALLDWVRKYRNGEITVPQDPNPPTPPGPPPSTPSNRFFLETGQYISHGIKEAWEAYERMPVQGGSNVAMELIGFPVTGEVHDTVGTWSGTVQYFQRARAEWHAELNPPRVLWGLLGAENMALKVGSQPQGGAGH